MQPGIEAACLQQLIVRPLLDEFSSLDDVDPMGRTDRAEPMCDDEHRASFGNLRHVLLNHRFRLVVQRAGGESAHSDFR